MREAADTRGDADLLRLVSEYLPIFFSRRHGDPADPELFFDSSQEPGRVPAIDYEATGRDIFQNWEALSQSFPGFLESIVAKFVNASTIDGHNPDRLTRRGSTGRSRSGQPVEQHRLLG